MSELREKIIDHFVEHLLIEGERPKTVFAFCRKIEIEESQFYEHFASFDTLELGIWKNLFQHTTQVVESDEAFQEYSARERYLGYCFTLVEQLKKRLSFYRISFGNAPIPSPASPFAKSLDETKEFVQRLIQYGEETDEIAKRDLFKRLMLKGFQFHLLFVVKFLITDSSDGFTSTDQAIEKSVNLFFDGLRKGVVDSAFDFAKFMTEKVRS